MGDCARGFGNARHKSCDYPDYAHLVATGIQDGRFDRGILICGTGIGISIAANRHHGICAALVTDAFSARLSREHNDSNVLCLGGRVVGDGLARSRQGLLETKADDGPRHARRLAQIELFGQRTMKCPFCGLLENRVIDSRLSANGETTPVDGGSVKAVSVGILPTSGWKTFCRRL